MRNLIVTCIAVICAISTQAQTRNIDQVYEKYAGKEGFTTVEVSEKLFTLCASALAGEDPEIQKLVAGLKGIKIITYENTENDPLAKAMYKEFEAALPAELEELMSVNSEGEKVKFYAKMRSEKVVDELILLVDADGEFVMIDIIGTIDFDMIGKLKDVSIDGLEELEKIENK